MCSNTKLNLLKLKIKNDIEACDMKWTFFVAAAKSYRYDSLLRPFPQSFSTGDQNCDIDRLIDIVKETPPFPILLKNTEDENYAMLNNDVIDILHWVLISMKDYELKSVEKQEFNEVLKKVPSIVSGAKPSHIFQVHYISNSAAEIKFQKYAEELSTNYAFHGSKLESFHCILNYGLHQHLSKVAAFGDGIYLSSEQSVSMLYSPSSVAWGASAIGAKLSCLAICEYVEHPLHLKCHNNDIKNSNFKINHNADVPEKYFVIRNNDIVRVRYLLIFGDHKPFKQEQLSVNGPINWIIKNKSILSICCYAIFLASIGIANSNMGVYYRRLLWNTLQTQFVDFSNIFR